MRLRVVGVLVLAVVLAGCGQGSSDNAGRGPARAEKTHSQPVGATGLVVARADAAVEFCSGGVLASPPHCGAGVRVVGVDLAALSDRRVFHGVTWGTAYLAGTLKDGILRVRQQDPPEAVSAGLRLTDPPCPAPVGGWAASQGHNISTAAVTVYRRSFPSDLTSVAIFSPKPGTLVVTLGSANPRRTFARLSAAYPDRLCVVRSRYALSVVRAATKFAYALLSPRTYGQPPYRVTEVGQTAGANGQPIVEISVIIDTTAIGRAVASQPPGLVKVVPWLTPVSE